MSNPGPSATEIEHMLSAALRERMGPRAPQLEEEAAILRAEQALQALSSKFGAWLRDDVDKLGAAREAMRRDGIDDATIDALFTHAHDLRGLGATYQFPLVARLASSLCALLGDGDSELHGPEPLLDAHIDAIKASVRDNVRTADNPVGAALAEELERHAADCLSAKGGA